MFFSPFLCLIHLPIVSFLLVLHVPQHLISTTWKPCVLTKGKATPARGCSKLATLETQLDEDTPSTW